MMLSIIFNEVYSLHLLCIDIFHRSLLLINEWKTEWMHVWWSRALAYAILKWFLFYVKLKRLKWQNDEIFWKNRLLVIFMLIFLGNNTLTCLKKLSFSEKGGKESKCPTFCFNGFMAAMLDFWVNGQNLI